MLLLLKCMSTTKSKINNICYIILRVRGFQIKNATKSNKSHSHHMPVFGYQMSGLWSETFKRDLGKILFEAANSWFEIQITRIL